MNETRRIENQLQRAYEGDAWHGPALREALEGVTAEEASIRPLPGVHTIWELVLHIHTWQDAVRRWIEGDGRRPTDEEDWSSAPTASPEAWKAALESVAAGNRAIRRTVAGLDDKRLDETLPGGSRSTYVLLHGVVQHTLYHTGQIALLKKAIATQAQSAGAGRTTG